MKKVKNIPTYYTFPGTKIFRDTTALPFKKGGPVNTSGPVAEPTPPIPITVENLNNIYPAFRNLENVVLTPDPTYTRDKTGLGDIEYIAPDRGAEPIRYPTGYELPVPQPGAHNIVYNPDSTTIENVKLDLFSHGLRTSDPTYQKYLAEFTKAYKKSHGKTMDHWYQQDSEAGYAEDGREQWDDNYIDGVLRGIFHGGTMSEKLNDRYNPTEEADTILDHPELIEKIGQIRTYLETPQLDYLQKSLQLPATFADGGPLHDRNINGKLLNSTYAPQLGDMFREGGPFKDDIGAFDYAKSIYASQLGDYYRTGGQFPRPYSLPEDSFKQGGRNLHNSVYASSPAQYPAVYNFGGTLKNNLATRQQMYMPLDHITRNGGSILSMSNTPEMSGEGKDLTVPDNAYYYANGGSMNTPWLHNLYANGGGLFDRFKRKNKEETTKTEQPAFGQPLPTDPQGAPYAFVGERPACGEGEVWDETSKSCVKKDIQELPTMYASAKPETNEKRIKFLDKANALWDTVEGRKVWMQNGPKNYSLNELSKFVHNAKDYKKQAEVYEKYRRMAQDEEISTDEFSRLYNENNWARFDQNTGRENFKGEYQQAVEKGNKEKEEYAKRMASEAENTFLEYSGINGLGRTMEHPIETLSDAGQTILDIGMAAPEVPYRLYDYATNFFTPWNRTTGQNSQYTDEVNPITGQPYWSGAQGAIDLFGSLPFFKLGTTAATAGIEGTINAVNKIPASKVLLQSAEQRLGNPTAYNLLQGTETGVRGKIANKYFGTVQKNIEKEADQILKKSLEARKNGFLVQADDIYRNEYIPKLQEVQAVDNRLLDWRLKYSGLPLENTGMGGGEGALYSLKGNPTQLAKVGKSFNTEAELNDLIEVGKNYQYPGAQFAFPTRQVRFAGGNGVTQFMPRLDYRGGLPANTTTADLAKVAEDMSQRGIGIDYAGLDNIGRVGDDMGFVDLTYIGKPGQRTSAYDWSMFHPEKNGRNFKLQEIPFNKPSSSLSSQGLIDDALRTTSNPTPVSLNIPENSAIGSPQLKTVLSANGTSAQARLISPDSPDFAAATAAIEAQKVAGNPTILKNYTNHEGLGYSSPEALMTAQAEEFKRATDFAHQWGLKDPAKFAELSAEAPTLKAASNQAYTNLSQAHAAAYDKFNTLRDNWLWANGHNPYDLEHIMTIADGEELAKARAILDEAAAAAEKDPELIQLKLEFDKAEEARKIAIAKQEKLGNALEQQMDPTVKAKIEKIFAASGQPMPPSNLAMQDIQGMVSAPKLLYSDPAHPSYTSLNPVERAEIESIKDRAGGVKLDNSTITFGSKISQPSIFSIETPNTSVQPEASINPLTWINPLKNPVKVPGSQNYVQVINEQLLHPEAVGSVNAHEIGHDIGRFYSWINQLQVNDPAFKYYTGTDKNPIAAVFKKFMVSPTAPVNNTFTTETWKSGVGELHANLMIVRNKAAQKLVKEGMTLKEAINTIKQLEAAGDDKLFNEYLNSTKIKQHFNKTATPEIRKQLLQYLPAVLGVIGTGAAIDANTSSESKTTKELKNGGYIPLYNFPNNKIKKFPTFTNR
jgi:hypothetical protein